MQNLKNHPTLKDCNHWVCVGYNGLMKVLGFSKEAVNIEIPKFADLCVATPPRRREER